MCTLYNCILPLRIGLFYFGTEEMSEHLQMYEAMTVNFLSSIVQSLNLFKIVLLCN
jgi:hypothetical protein